MEEAIAATAIKITVFVQEGLRLARGSITSTRFKLEGYFKTIWFIQKQ